MHSILDKPWVAQLIQTPFHSAPCLVFLESGLHMSLLPAPLYPATSFIPWQPLKKLQYHQYTNSCLAVPYMGTLHHHTSVECPVLHSQGVISLTIARSQFTTAMSSEESPRRISIATTSAILLFHI